MEFGVVLPQGLMLDLPETDAVNQFHFVKNLASEAENLRFNSIWFYDHLLLTEPRMLPSSTFECWTTLAALAAMTKRIRLGTVVTCNAYRNPALLAKSISVLDNISEGRMDFGIGAGWYDSEFTAFGLPFEKASIRIERLNEAVKIIRSMWLDDVTNFHGRFYVLEGAVNYPKPVQQPHPPILIGGSGSSVLKIVAQFANICNFSPPIDKYKEAFARLANHCDLIGRNPGEIKKSLLTDIVIRKTSDQVTEFMRKIEREGLLLGKYLGNRQWESISPATYGQNNVVGTPDECVEKLRKFKAEGVELFQFYFPLTEQGEAMKLLSERVLPELQ